MQTTAQPSRTYPALKLEPVRTLTTHRIRTSTTPEQLRTTIRMIGNAIIRGSSHLPLRTWAASVATRAPAKDFGGQVRALYDEMIRLWRYVKDPTFTEAVVTSGDAMIAQVLGANAPPGCYGFGDCDDIAATAGAVLTAIGMPVEIVTSAPAHVRGIFSHVFVRTLIPGRGWVTFDPVGHPLHDLGWTPGHARFAIWDLNGRLKRTIGAFGRHAAHLRAMQLHGAEEPAEDGRETTEADAMNVQESFPDQGLEQAGLAGTDEPINWNQYGLLGFGAFAGTMGVIDAPQLLMEYDDSDTVLGADGAPYVRTKMLEMSPTDWKWIAAIGKPRLNSVALADDGSIYQWQEPVGLGWGFFKKIMDVGKKLVGGVVKGAMKIGGKILKGAKALIAKLPGGKYLVKLFDKIHAISMKLVRPLLKLVGPLAKRLAPIAAIIPGYGTVVAAALYTAGTVAQIAAKYGVKRDKKGKPIFKSGKQAVAFQKSLHAAAAHAKKTGLDKKFLAAKRLKAQGKKVPPFHVIAAHHHRKHGAPPDVATPTAESIGRAIAFYMRQAQAPAPPMPGPGGAPQLIKAGSPQYVPALRGLGFDIPEA